ncbi:MAG: type VI secretion system protein TssA [Alphaproteobacteria bacterium]|nr:type VI secretion system protein TssA [Alphaproteobacteria bacterium]
MTAEALLDPKVQLLLKPISGKKPCGEYLRYTEIYDHIRDARREDDEKLPQGVWKTEIKKADWDKVAHICQDTLKNRSKDIQIAAWLTEAWLHLEGIAGLTWGLELILGLTQNFWNDLHPQIKKGSYEFRAVPYEWINTRLSEEVYYILISLPSDRSVLSYRFLDYLEANRLELVGKRNQLPVMQPKEDNHPSLAKISLSIDQTSTTFYRYMDESCIRALALMVQVEEELRFRLAGEAPAFYKLREKIDSIHRFACQILSVRGEKQKAKKLTTEPLRPEKAALTGSIETREQAYLILEEVATYLERIEPHSPTPYLIRRAINWGGMSLSQLVSDTFNNNQDMSLLLDILNIKRTP